MGYVVLPRSSRRPQHQLRIDREELRYLRHISWIIGVGRRRRGGGRRRRRILFPFLPDVGSSKGVSLQVQRLRSGHHAHPERGRYHGPHSRIQHSHAFRWSLPPPTIGPPLVEEHDATCRKANENKRDVDVLFREVRACRAGCCADGARCGSRLPGWRPPPPPPPKSRPSPPTLPHHRHTTPPLPIHNCCSQDLQRMHSNWYTHISNKPSSKSSLEPVLYIIFHHHHRHFYLLVKLLDVAAGPMAPACTSTRLKQKRPPVMPIPRVIHEFRTHTTSLFFFCLTIS